VDPAPDLVVAASFCQILTGIGNQGLQIRIRGAVSWCEKGQIFSSDFPSCVKTWGWIWIRIWIAIKMEKSDPNADRQQNRSQHWVLYWRIGKFVSFM
jgi:hypothetical protein